MPCLRLLSLSFQDTDTGDFTLAAYARAFGVPVYTRILGTTFAIAFDVTLLCLVLGYPVAYWLSRQPKRRQRLLGLLVLFPFWTSALVKNFVWLVLLGHMGVIAGVLKSIGIAQPPELLFSRGTVVFGMTHTMLPLAIITMLPVMNQIDSRLPMAAATMGASGVQAFWRVFFQLSVPGVAAAGLLVFIASLGFFITPALLGGPRETMLGQMVIQQILGQQNWQFASALADHAGRLGAVHLPDLRSAVRPVVDVRRLRWPQHQRSPDAPLRTDRSRARRRGVRCGCAEASRLTASRLHLAAARLCLDTDRRAAAADRCIHSDGIHQLELSFVSAAELQPSLVPGISLPRRSGSPRRYVHSASASPVPASR